MTRHCNTRLIARLDIKGPNLIKGVHLEGLRVIGNPHEHAYSYYEQGADELIFMDSVASLYGRNHLADIIKKAVKNIFVPLTVGGGVRSVEDAAAILRSGADKVAINTAAVANPELISQIAAKFGNHCAVISVEAKQLSSKGWEVLTENGRERSGRDVIEWVMEATYRGAGEILLTSVDREGTRKGFDVDLLRAVNQSVNVPIIASGGIGTSSDAIDAVNIGGADAVAMADILHYKRLNIGDVRNACRSAGLQVRSHG
ncbi:MAG: imidazole glycerol phosphate synthase cyclase subunit [Pseudomonadota bacterium]|nr:imidazole glycerol phosphate synthase cyclase subunit [Pseudomonadota bacterium]